MKKLVFVVPVYKDGGAERVTDMIATELQATGCYDVTLLVQQTESMFVDMAQRKGLKLEYLPTDKDYYRSGMAVALGSKLHEMGADIAVVTVAIPDQPDLIRREAPGCKLLFHLHGKPLFEYGNILAERCDRHPWPMNRLRRLREMVTHLYRRHVCRDYRRVYDAVDGYVVLCDAYRRNVERLLKIDSGSSRVVAMYNPLSEAILAMTPEEALRPRSRTVLYVGRLSYPDKRVDRLIRIWARVAPKHPEWRLRIVGDGPERGALEAQVQELGIEGSVEFCGYATNIVPYLSDASILCLTSQFEGWGMVLAEAQAAGVWPMSFNVSAGVEELIGTDGTRGTLVKPYSEAAYARALSELMDDPARLDALRPGMMASIRRYTPAAIAAAWDSYLRSLSGDR